MNRDPQGNDITRDPIYLLQAGTRQWTAIPDGCEFCDGLQVENIDDVSEWMLPFIKKDEDGYYNINENADFWKTAKEVDNDYGWPMVRVEWKTVSVFLTRKEGTEYGEKHAYRWDEWRVYCTPCDGELARILNEYKE